MRQTMIPENMLLLPKAQPHRTAQTDPVRNTVTGHISMGTNINSVSGSGTGGGTGSAEGKGCG